MSRYPEIVLRKGRDFSVQRGHPWIFSGAIESKLEALKDGDVVRVVTTDRKPLGVGHYAKGGSIAVKMLCTTDRPIDQSFYRARIAEAASYRASLELGSKTKTTGYRLINGEGDELPGLIVDIYNDVAVLQAQSEGMFRARDEIADALRHCLGEKITAIVDRSTTAERSLGEGAAGQYLFGEAGDPLIKEEGLLFHVDWLKGQKTGFFLDQRENRRFVRSIAAGKKVLNAFCYSGGFSIAALAGDACQVLSLDSSEKALQLLEINLRENEKAQTIPAAYRHETICDDFLRHMQKMEREYDLIVLDPPAFAKHRKALDSGLRGYRSINSAALRGVRNGGFLLSFSCSQLVSRNDFRDILIEAVHKAGRRARIVKELHQAPCHPVNIFHPEGEYLKGFALQVFDAGI